MKRTNQSTGVVIGLFILSLTAFLYLNTRTPNNHDNSNRSRTPSVIMDSTKTKKRQIKQAISSNPAFQAIHFIEETNELVGFHRQ